MSALNAHVEQRHLVDAISWVARSATGVGITPVMAGVLIESHDDGLVLSAMNYETSATMQIPAAVTAPGRVLVSARLLERITKLLPKTTVTITDEGPRLQLTAGGRYGLPTMPLDEYPARPKLPTIVGEVGGAAWAQAARQVAVAGGAKDASPPWLAAVLIELGEQMTLAATNRYHLAAIDLPWQPALGIDTAAPLRIPVPVSTLADFAKTMQLDGPLTLHYEDGLGVLGLHTATRTATMRLAAVEWPEKWRERTIPAEQPISVLLPVGDLESAVRRAAALTDQQEPTVLLELGDDQLHVSLNATDDVSGVGQETIAVDYQDEPLSIRVRIGYLLDALANLDGAERARVGLSTSKKPLALRPADEGAGAHLRLVMPVIQVGVSQSPRRAA